MAGQTFYQQIEAVTDTLPAVESWNPPLSGDMDCLIKRDGSWHIDGSRVENDRLIRLFSTVLKHEDNSYFLVTPIEKWRINVEDMPFTVVELDISKSGTDEQLIQIRTNVGDWITIDAEHFLGSSPIAGLAERQGIPYVCIRANLMARFNRNTYLQLAELLQADTVKDQYTIVSANKKFTLNFQEFTD